MDPDAAAGEPRPIADWFADYLRAVTKLELRGLEAIDRAAMAGVLVGRTLRTGTGLEAATGGPQEEVSPARPAPKLLAPGPPDPGEEGMPSEWTQEEIPEAGSVVPGETPAWLSETTALPEVMSAGAEEPLPLPSLFPPAETRAIVAHLLSSPVPSGRVDIEGVLDHMTRGKLMPRRLPREVIPSLRRGAQILVDLDQSMDPFARDRANLLRTLRDLCRHGEILRFTGEPEAGVRRAGERGFAAYGFPARGVPVVVLSTLGMTGPDERDQAASRRYWMRFAEQARDAGCPVAAVTPVPASDWDRELAGRIQCIPWDRGTTARLARNLVGPGLHIDRTFRAARLATDRLPPAADPPMRARRETDFRRALSLAVLIEPELIRAMRLKLFSGLDVGAESRVWWGPEVDTRNALGVLFKAADRNRLRRELAERPGLLDAAWNVIQRLHENGSPAVRQEEELAYLTLSPRPADRERAAGLLRQWVAALFEPGRPRFPQWARQAWTRLPGETKSSVEGQTVGQALALRFQETAATLLAELPEGSRRIPEWMLGTSGTETRELGVRFVPGGLEFGAPDLPEAHGFPVPATELAVLRLEWREPEGDGWRERSERIDVSAEVGSRLELVAAKVRLRTPLGETYLLERFDAVLLNGFDDPEPVGRLLEALDRAGVQVWNVSALLQRRAAYWHGDMERQADRVGVGLWVQGPWRLHEDDLVGIAVAGRMRAAGRIVVPVVVARVSVSELPEGIREFQAIHVSDPRSDEEGMRQLVEALRAARRPQPHEGTGPHVLIGDFLQSDGHESSTPA